MSISNAALTQWAAWGHEAAAKDRAEGRGPHPITGDNTDPESAAWLGAYLATHATPASMTDLQAEAANAVRTLREYAHRHRADLPVLSWDLATIADLLAVLGGVEGDH
jgi:hypothetical protein